MHQAAFVRVLQTQGGLPRRLARLGNGPGAALLRYPRQIHAIQQFHDHEGNAVFDAGIAGPHQMGMLQTSQRLNLPLEAALRIAVAGKARR